MFNSILDSFKDCTTTSKNNSIAGTWDKTQLGARYTLPPDCIMASHFVKQRWNRSVKPKSLMALKLAAIFVMQISTSPSIIWFLHFSSKQTCPYLPLILVSMGPFASRFIFVFDKHMGNMILCNLCKTSSMCHFKAICLSVCNIYMHTSIFLVDQILKPSPWNSPWAILLLKYDH